jgi:hypothetical protein
LFRFGALAAGLLTLGLNAKADYSSTILSDSPAAYYRLSDWPTNYATATNGGSGGAALNGQYQFNTWFGAPGAIAGDSDTCVQFGGLARVQVPYSAALNPASGPFSVECWAMVTNTTLTTVYRSPVSSRNSGSVGYILYANSANKWSFWTSSNSVWVTLDGPVVNSNVWVHVIGTHDAAGTNRLYINGALQATKYVPAFVANTNQALRIGCGANETIAGDYYFPGRVDEVAFYTNQLTDAQIAAHYANGTNAARTVPYSQLVTTDGPVGYWRLDDLAATPNTAVNAGTLGAAGNGTFIGSPDTVLPGQQSALQTDTFNYAMGFSNATTYPFGGKAQVAYNAALNPATNFSVEAWAYVPSLYRDYQALVSSRDYTASVTRGFMLFAHNTGKWEFWTGRLATWNTCIATNSIINTAWNHVVGTYDGTYQSLYVNGELVGVFKVVMPYVPNLSKTLWLGAGGNELLNGNYFLLGGLDEAAVYGTTLSQTAVANHYAAAFTTPPAVVTAPYFAAPPPNTTNQIGAAIRLDAIAYGGVPMQYQWLKDGVPLPDQTNFVLTIASAAYSDSGYYQLSATNAAGGAVSDQAYLQILPPSAPVITVDLPAALNVYPGGSPKLQVTVAGSTPFTYLWTSNGVVLPVGSDPSLTLNNVQPGLNGAQFSVLITNAYGFTNSAVATLTVATLNPASYASVMLADNPISYWRLGEDPTVTATALDCWGGNNGQYVNAYHYTPGALGLDDDGAVQLTGTGTGSHVAVPNTAPYGFTGTNAFTLVAWARPEVLNGISVQRVFSTRAYHNNLAQGGIGFGFRTNTSVRFTAFGVVDVDFVAPVVAGQWQHIAVVRSGTSVVLYHNGVAIGTNNNVVLIVPSDVPLGLGANLDPTSGDEAFNGELDEMAIFGTPLSGAQIKALYSSRNGAKPNLVQAPQSITTYPGGTAQFSVIAAGTPPLSYQWKANGVALAGQTNSVLWLTNVQTSANGLQCSVTVTNLAGSTNSAPATLLVPTPSGLAARVIQDKPVAYWRLDDPPGPLVHDIWGGHDGTTNGYVSFQTSPGALFNDPDTAMTFDGATAKVVVPWSADVNPLVFSLEAWARVTGGAGSYRAVISSRDLNDGYVIYAGLNNTWQFWIRALGVGWQTLTGPPVVEGEWTHLVATFDGANMLLYVNGVLAASEVNTNYTPNLTLGLRIGAGNNEESASVDYNFPGDIDEVAVYNSVLNADRVTLHYGLGAYSTTTAPFIVGQPASQAILVGGTASLSVQATGSPTLLYQWFKDGTPVAGATTSVLTISNAYYTQAGAYSVAITNGVGFTNSASASLSVGAPPLFANLTNDLVLHLKFDNDTLDSSGHGNNGIVVNSPTFVSGRLGQALHYETDVNAGTYNYVTLGTPADLQFGTDVNFSVAYWARFTGTPYDLPFLCSAIQSYSNPGLSFAPGYGTGTWSYSLDSADGSSKVETGSATQLINDGQWHHLVHVFDRAGLGRTYLDGVLVDSRSITNLGSADTGLAFNIGQDPSGTYAVTAAADIDDLGIWRRALTEYEAQSIYGAAQTGQSFDVYGPVKLTIRQSGTGLELIWQAGTLQQADDVSGTYTTVSGAAAPYYKVTPGLTRKFYRIQL